MGNSCISRTHDEKIVVPRSLKFEDCDLESAIFDTKYQVFHREICVHEAFPEMVPCSKIKPELRKRYVPCGICYSESDRIRAEIAIFRRADTWIPACSPLANKIASVIDEVNGGYPDTNHIRDMWNFALISAAAASENEEDFVCKFNEVFLNRTETGENALGVSLSKGDPKNLACSRFGMYANYWLDTITWNGTPCMRESVFKKCHERLAHLKMRTPGGATFFFENFAAFSDGGNHDRVATLCKPGIFGSPESFEIWCSGTSPFTLDGPLKNDWRNFRYEKSMTIGQRLLNEFHLTVENCIHFVKNMVGVRFFPRQNRGVVAAFIDECRNIPRCSLTWCHDDEEKFILEHYDDLSEDNVKYFVSRYCQKISKKLIDRIGNLEKISEYIVGKYLLQDAYEYLWSLPEVPTRLFVRLENGFRFPRLIERGLDPNEKLKDGQTVIDIAIDRGDVELAELCMKNGGDPNNRSYLLKCIKNTQDPAIMRIAELLVKAGADTTNMPLIRAAIDAMEPKGNGTVDALKFILGGVTNKSAVELYARQKLGTASATYKMITDMFYGHDDVVVGEIVM